MYIVQMLRCPPNVIVLMSWCLCNPDVLTSWRSYVLMSCCSYLCADVLPLLCSDVLPLLCSNVLPLLCSDVLSLLCSDVLSLLCSDVLPLLCSDVLPLLCSNCCSQVWRIKLTTRLHRMAGRYGTTMQESTISLGQGLWIWILISQNPEITPS
jgi:hypothetical protein